MLFLRCSIPRNYEVECLGNLPLSCGGQFKSTVSLPLLGPLSILNVLH